MRFKQTKIKFMTREEAIDLLSIKDVRSGKTFRKNGWNFLKKDTYSGLVRTIEFDKCNYINTVIAIIDEPSV